jgi:cytoskeleton protein RodZ
MASVGETLRSAREQRGLSIEQASHDTRISARFIEALEADRYDALPAPVYVRGFLRSYASYLKLDGSTLLARLDDSGVQTSSAATMAGIAIPPREPRGASADPFRREARPPRPEEQPRTESSPVFETDEHDFASAQTVRSRGFPGATPPLTPPLPLPREEYDPGGFPRQSPYLQEETEGHGPRRYLAVAGLALLGVGIAVITGVMLTRGGDGNVATTVPGGDESPTRGAGTVVVVDGSPSPAPSGTATPGSPGAPSGGSATPSPSGTPGSRPTPGEPTPTPNTSNDDPTPTQDNSASTATPTVTVTAGLPTPTPTEALPPTPTPIPTFTPTSVPVQAHPRGPEECLRNNGDCGPSPLRVICAPDGWFIDVLFIDGAYPNPGWPETSVTSSGQAEDACS